MDMLRASVKGSQQSMHHSCQGAKLALDRGARDARLTSAARGCTIEARGRFIVDSSPPLAHHRGARRDRARAAAKAAKAPAPGRGQNRCV